MHLSVSSLMSPFTILLTISLASAKNCTRDPLTYITHPLAYLAAHPFLTLEIDELCHDIRHFSNILSDLNITKLEDNHPNLSLNTTEISSIVANVTAELSILTSNATLVRLCRGAREVEDDCWPLVYDEWKVNRPECKTLPKANETEIAKKNSTLVSICGTFVKQCNDNVTVTDAALKAVNLTSSDTATSTSTPTPSSTASSSSAGATSGANQITWPSSRGLITSVLAMIGIFMLC